MTLAYIYSKIVKKYLRGKCILRSNIHKTAVISSGCNVVESTMGRYSYIGYDSTMVKCNVGSFCSIADCVYIGGAEHPMEWVSTSPVFQKVRHSGPTKRYAKFELPQIKTTTIGNDVWIGHGVIIKQGVIIGHGAVIGSGAVVTKDIEPYSIVVGCPAKHIKYRFDEQLRNDLLSTQWWNLSDEELSRLGRYAQQPKEFVKHLKK